MGNSITCLAQMVPLCMLEKPDLPQDTAICQAMVRTHIQVQDDLSNEWCP